jgi:hypothetical protein
MNLVQRAVLNGGKLAPILIKEGSNKGTGLMNPSVFIDDDGETALFQTFNIDKIHLLLQYIPPQYHSNYLNYRNSDDKTAYQVAQDAGEHKVCEYLASIGATYGGKKGKKNTRKGKGCKKRRKTKGKR